jgi:outer membrane protein assembly factor BamB
MIDRRPYTFAVAAALAALAVLAACGTAGAADWLTARGNPQRTGNVDDIPGPKAPKVLWVYKAAEDFVAPPVPGQGAIYLGALGAFNTGAFHAIATAPEVPERVLWSKIAPAISRPTVCAPVVVGGLVIFGDGMHQTDDAVLYCVQAKDGMSVWRLPLPGKLVHLEAGPAVDKDRVYACGGDAGVLCVDLKRVTLDGREQDLAAVLPGMAKQWAELTAKYERDKQANPQTAVPPSEDALPKPVPKLLWQQGKGKWHIDAPPAVSGDFVLAASAYLEDEKIGKRCLVCLKAADGSVVWETPLAINPWAGPTVAGNLVLVGCSSIRFDRKLLGEARGEVAAFDLAGGKLVWREAVPGGVLAPVAVKGDVAVYTCTDGRVLARKCPSGQLLWTYEGGKPFFAGPAIAGDTVFAADLKSIVHAVGLADGKPRWKLDVAGDPSVQSRTMVFGSPVVHGGDLYLATCNIDGQSDQPCAVVCLSDKPPPVAVAAAPVTVDRQKRTIRIPCKIAPRKLATLKDVYPLEVIATYPTPRGQKAHETVVIFECTPSEVHRALESFGLKPGRPIRGEGSASGPQLRVFLEYPSFTGKPRTVPMEKAIVDVRTGKCLPPLAWHFTGSVLRQPDPDKEDKVYGADLGGTLITLLPVTDETVVQSSMGIKDEKLMKMETNKNIVPPEGTEVHLIIQAE